MPGILWTYCGYHHDDDRFNPVVTMPSRRTSSIIANVPNPINAAMPAMVNGKTTGKAGITRSSRLWRSSRQRPPTGHSRVSPETRIQSLLPPTCLPRDSHLYQASRSRANAMSLLPDNEKNSRSAGITEELRLCLRRRSSFCAQPSARGDWRRVNAFASTFERQSGRDHNGAPVLRRAMVRRRVATPTPIHAHRRRGPFLRGYGAESLRCEQASILPRTSGHLSHKSA